MVLHTCVTYWPSTELSIKKQVHPVEDIRISAWPVDVVEFDADAMPTGSRWASNNYITRCHRRFELVGVRGRQSSVWVAVTVRVPIAVGDKMPLWEPAPDRGLGPSGPPVEQPNRMRKKCCYNTEELGVNMWQSVPSPTHLSHITNINPFATLSRIKCERYIFLKKCVHSPLLLIKFPHVYVYV